LLHGHRGHRPSHQQHGAAQRSPTIARLGPSTNHQLCMFVYFTCCSLSFNSSYIFASSHKYSSTCSQFIGVIMTSLLNFIGIFSMLRTRIVRKAFFKVAVSSSFPLGTILYTTCIF
jgi:hypothetical protein